MKASLNWLKEYIDLDMTPEKIGEILTEIGLEVEGMEKKETIKGGLENFVIGEVLDCWKHPNADRLTLTKVSVGQDDPLQIVCGAPNVASGQKVVVALPGAVLYDSKGNSFTIKKTKMRGEASEGMICAEDELGLGDDHSGIMVLPEDTPVGMAASDYFELETDIVYDIGLTPNRSDATSHLGIARDLAAALQINYDHSGELKAPDVSGFEVHDRSHAIEVEVKQPEACPRYTGVSIAGIEIGESPAWLRNRLLSIGVRPINNIVDITNFVLHELGQPLHAFDLDEVADKKIIVDTLKEGTRFVTLDEKERKLNPEDLMICDGKREGMCIAGVFGGVDCGVTEKTTNIFLESAHFNPKWIRRTSFRHLLRTDAAMCFEKGSDPNITAYALKRAALLIRDLAGGTISSDIIDIYPKPIKPVEVYVRYCRIQLLLGVEISSEEIKAILDAMHMTILEEKEEGLKVAVPTDKADVTREADVIEEILRIYGFNKIPTGEKIKSALNIKHKPDPVQLRNKISDFLSSNGFHEMMGLSLSMSSYFEKTLPRQKEELVYINNTSNPTLDVMRPSVIPTALEAARYNINRQHSDLKLYEFGKIYFREEGEISEEPHLSLLLGGKRWKESWITEERTVSFFTVKTYVGHILHQLGVQEYETRELDNGVWAYGLSYSLGDRVLVKFGLLDSDLVSEFEIEQEIFMADFHWDRVVEASKGKQPVFEPLDRFPSVRRDLALVIDNSVKFEDIAYIAKNAGKPILRKVDLFDVYRNEEQLGKGKKSYAVSLIFQDKQKTLKDKEVDQRVNRMIKQFEKELNAVIRQ